MHFNWLQFLRQRSVPFADQGKNVKRGNVNVKCPWCGHRDPDKHLGINVETGEWGCWRDSQHRGIRPHRLIVALTGLTWDEAEVLVQGGLATEVGYEGLKKRAEQLFSQAVAKPKGIEAVEYEAGIREITGDLYARFLAYLQKRGFAGSVAKDVAAYYQLRCSLAGRWKYRLVLPFYMGSRKVGWTGRAIVKTDLRYLSYPDSSVVKRLLFNYDHCLPGGKVLAIVEGPLDCLKVDWFGKGAGVRSVATLGVNVTDTQIELLLRLSQRFDHTVIVPDANAFSQAIQLKSRLVMAGAKIQTIPDGVEDPGALDGGQVVPLFSKFI